MKRRAQLEGGAAGSIPFLDTALTRAGRRHQRPEDGVQEEPFRQRTFHVTLAIDDGARDSEDVESFRKLGEFGSFNAIGADKLAFHGELVRQAHGRRAVRSGGGRKHLQVKRLAELRQLRAAFRLQARIARRNGDDRVKQSGKLISGRQSKKAYAVIPAIADHRGRYFVDGVLGDFLLVRQKIEGLKMEFVGNLRQLFQQLPGFTAILKILVLGKMHQPDRIGHFLEPFPDFRHIGISKQSQRSPLRAAARRSRKIHRCKCSWKRPALKWLPRIGWFTLIGDSGAVDANSTRTQGDAWSLRCVRDGRDTPVLSPSLQLLQTALLVMALCSLVLGTGMFFLMQVRYSRNLSRGTRRLTFANLMGSPWDAKNLEQLWEESASEDRVAIEDVLATESYFPSELEASVFRSAVTSCSVYTSWLQRLRSGGMLERVRAARMLGHFPDERGIRALAGALHDRSPKVVLSCLLSLGRLRALSSVPALVKSLPELPGTIPSVTLTAVLAGCARQEPESLAGLMKAADVRLRLVGAWAISEIADASVLPDLVSAAGDSHPEVRAKVARGLARIPDSASVAALQILVRDPVWFVRYRALRALGDLRAPEATEAALVALADEVREVRFGAAYALRQPRVWRAALLLICSAPEQR